jgi:hypothetical protein
VDLDGDAEHVSEEAPSKDPRKRAKATATTASKPAPSEAKADLVVEKTGHSIGALVSHPLETAR